MISIKSRAASYEFTKDLAAHVLYAEVRHFAATMSIHGRTETEVRTLTRRLAWITDRDLNWCEVDRLIAYAADLRTVTTDHARGALLIELFWEITTTLGAMPARWENAA